MPPFPDLSVLARVRWGNVAIVVMVLVAGGLVVAWPSLRAQAPPLPPAAPRPVSALRATTARTTPPPPPPEFGVESTAPVARTPAVAHRRDHKAHAHKPVHQHPAVKRRPHRVPALPPPLQPTPAPAPSRPPVAPPAPPIPHPNVAPPSVSSEFPPSEF
jgi:hypothetical protein